MTTHLQLPFTFDVERLMTDMNVALKHHWQPHFNTAGYTGEWKSIALMAPEGDASNIRAMTDANEKLEATAVLKACPYFQEVLAQFPCEFSSVRLLNLAPGAEILPHRDYNLGYEDGIFRLHVPIQTNAKVSFQLDGEDLAMLAGQCWYTNVNFEHSVANRSSEERVHLVFDCLRNDWSDALFYSLAPKESFDPPVPEMDAATLQRIIEELENQGSPESLALIASLKKAGPHS